MNGFGVLIYEDCSKFEGEFQNNLPHGKGTLTSPNGILVEGNFLFGKLNGEGTAID